MDISQSKVVGIISYSGHDLVDEYSGALYKFCRSLTYSKEEAEDLFQETFMKAFEQLEKINVANNPQGILFNIAAFTWKSWKRRYARRSRIAPIEPLTDNIKDDVSIEEQIIEQEESYTIRTLVEALPERFKLPTILYYSLGMSVSDIACALKLPPGTIKSRLSKARQLIKKGLNYYE